MSLTKKGPTADFPVVRSTIRKDSPKITDSYIQVMRQDVERTVQAASAYANKRAQVSLRIKDINPRLAYRIVSRAEFIPAHPSRFQIFGPGREPKFVNFIVHRPGGIDFRPFRGGKTGTIGRNYTLKDLVDLATTFCSLTNLEVLFRTDEAPVCTHFLIGLNGELIQMVDLADKANHVKTFKNHPKFNRNIFNSNSVGVELEGIVQPYGKDYLGLNEAERAMVASPFPAAQLQTLAWLLRWFKDNPHYNIPLDDQHILLHLDIDPAERTDPGENFKGQLNTVLEAAKSLPTITERYQEPVSIDASEERAVALLSGKQSISVAQLEEFRLALTGIVKGASRASKMSAAERADYYSAAISHNATLNAARLTQVSMAQQTETILASAKLTPQKSRTSFNYETQQWEDS